MAKLNSTRFKEVARATFTQGNYTGIVVLRSDGKVLLRYTGSTPTGYIIVSTLKPGVPVTAETLARIAGRRGLVIDTVTTKV